MTKTKRPIWTKWRDLTTENLNSHWSQSPGVYYIRLVTRRGDPVPIHRILGKDPKGILYIGMARIGADGGLCNRLWGFWTASTGKDETPHGAGRKWRRLLSKHFPHYHLQYSYRQLSRVRMSQKLEIECLANYQKRWGELPSLNRAGVEHGKLGMKR